MSATPCFGAMPHPETEYTPSAPMTLPCEPPPYTDQDIAMMPPDPPKANLADPRAEGPTL